MLFDFFEGWSLAGLLLQNISNDIFEAVGDCGALGEAIRDCLNLLICLLNIFRFEWRSSKGESEHDDTEAPDVHLVAMPFRFKYFRSNVVWRPTNGLPLVSRELNSTCQTKIAQLQRHGLCEEEIA